jgi:ATP-binding cassette, subfamily B, bacterial
MSTTEVRPKVGLRGVLARLIHVYGVIFEMAWSAARARAAAMFSLMLALGVAGAVSALMARSVIDGITSGDPTKALTFGAIVLAILVTTTVMNDLLQLLQVDMSDRISHEVDLRLMAVSAGAPGLDHLERSEFADRMKQVRERQWLPAEILRSIGSAAFVLCGMVAAIVLLGTVHPALVALPFVMVPSAWLQFRGYRRHWAEFNEAAPEQRLADHYMKLATGETGAKEIRLFGLRDHVLAEHKRLSDAYVAKMFRARLKQSAQSTLGGLLYGLSLTGAIGFIGYLALHGRATPGQVYLGVQVTRLALGHVEMAAELVAGLAEMAFMGEKYLWLLRYTPSVTVREPEHALPAPTIIRDGITLQNVSFHYPGTEKLVLHDVNLFIPSSATIALVGENGAGKSSIVKLLSRFYDPTEGRILIDGIDLRELDLEGWRTHMSTAFQDFVRFQLVAREAVGVGQLERIEDGVRVGDAVRFAGAHRIVDKLPDGIETQLGRQFKGGMDLSEGEWQRFALARGSMRDDPALIVLDEPTASLDARAEHEVFERFAEIEPRRAAGSSRSPCWSRIGSRRYGWPT